MKKDKKRLYQPVLLPQTGFPSSRHYFALITKHPLCTLYVTWGKWRKTNQIQQNRLSQPFLSVAPLSSQLSFHTTLLYLDNHALSIYASCWSSNNRDMLMLVYNKDIDGDLFKIFHQLLWSYVFFQLQPIEPFCFATYFYLFWLIAIQLLTWLMSLSIYSDRGCPRRWECVYTWTVGELLNVSKVKEEM